MTIFDTTEAPQLPLYRVLPFELVNICGGKCANCGEQFKLSTSLRNTDVEHRLVLSCTSCGDLALFNVLPG